MGPALVLVTWTVALTGVIVVGLPFALLAGRTVSLSTLRVAMWIGLLVGILVTLAVSLMSPLREASAAVALGATVVLALGVTVALRPRWRLRRAGSGTAARSGWAVAAFLAVLAVSAAFLAVAVLGPVTNYDSGLYHLGAIAYAGDYATIPGLANVYQAFGYSNSMFPYAAVLGNGPWDGEGYRLANGLLMAAMAVDLILRLIERRSMPGTYILIVAVAAAWVPLVALSDYWVTSPTSDPAVMVFSLVSLAYLADALKRPADVGRNAAVAFTLAILAYSMRPTMVFFLVTMVAVLLVRLWRLRRAAGGVQPQMRMPVLVAVLGVVLVVLQTARDYLLSGWLQYPLSIWHFDVPWLALDPVNTRASTLGTARDPSNYLEAVNGWSWVGGWLARLPQQWEFFEFLALCAFAVACGVAARRVTGAPVLTRSLALLMLPSLVAVVTWWVASPPTFRFVWGPLFGLAIAPAGWFLYLVARRGASSWRHLVVPVLLVATSAVIMVVVVFSAAVRLDYGAMTQERAFAVGPLSVTYFVAPVPVPETVDAVMPSGLVLKRPVPSDQCWAAYPLCTPLIESPVAARGDSIQDGFTP